MTSAGRGYEFERWAGPMRRAAVGQPCRGCGRIMVTGRGPTAASVDHIDPLALGGSNDPSNGRVLCVSCNAKLGRALRTRLERARKSQGRRRPRVVVTSRAW